MQTKVLFVTLALMLIALILILRPILATDGAPPKPNANTIRKRFLYGLVIFGVVVSIASLREWPHTRSGSNPTIVNVTSGQWWWDIDTTEIAMGQQVEFRVTTEDVNHGLGIYDSQMRLLVQVQAMPGYTNHVVYTFEKPGTYSILCMELCGIAHHDMTYQFEVTEVSS
ncbi:cytochrome C oxidase subunit I [Rhodobacteraceae bacterium]|nr:cytochrome C oxidase subunit I [Paracoccaceae bacterium]